MRACFISLGGHLGDKFVGGEILVARGVARRAGTLGGGSEILLCEFCQRTVVEIGLGVSPNRYHEEINPAAQFGLGDLFLGGHIGDGAVENLVVCQFQLPELGLLGGERVGHGFEVAALFVQFGLELRDFAFRFAHAMVQPPEPAAQEGERNDANRDATAEPRPGFVQFAAEGFNPCLQGVDAQGKFIAGADRRVDVIAFLQAGAVLLLEGLAFRVLGRMLIVRKAGAANKDVDGFAELRGEFIFELGVAAPGFAGIARTRFRAVNLARNMDDGVAGGDLHAEHLPHRARIGREVGLLDRHAAEGEQRLLDQLPAGAQVLARGADENLRAVG